VIELNTKPELYCELCGCHTRHYSYHGIMVSGKEVVSCDLHPNCVVRLFEDGPPVVHKATVPEALREAAATYEQRNKLWGDNYKQVGAIMVAMLPAGVKLETADDWNRFLLFGHVINKVTRYAQNLNTGGNKDSAHDLTVYAAMLEEMTNEH
jgi:hypothetical protein